MKVSSGLVYRFISVYYEEISCMDFMELVNITPYLAQKQRETIKKHNILIKLELFKLDLICPGGGYNSRVMYLKNIK